MVNSSSPIFDVGRGDHGLQSEEDASARTQGRALTPLAYAMEADDFASALRKLRSQRFPCAISKISLVQKWIAAAVTARRDARLSSSAGVTPKAGAAPINSAAEIVLARRALRHVEANFVSGAQLSFRSENMRSAAKRRRGGMDTERYVDVDGSVLRSWVDSAQGGERRVYFMGYLPRASRMFRLANVARDLHAAGKIYLYQKRLGEEAYAYIAERRR